MRFYVEIDGEERGPIDSMQLRALAERGALRRENWIRKAESNHWHPAHEVKGLFTEEEELPADALVLVETPTEEPTVDVSTITNLRPCPDCGRMVSRRADQCPGCGCPLPETKVPSTLNWHMLIRTVAISVAVLFVLVKSCSYLASPPTSTDRSRMAWVMAQEFVKDRLKSPGTADFGGIEQTSSTCVTVLGNDEYRVTGWVDSQNTFGGIARTDFTLTVKYNGNDRWSLVDEPVLVPR